MEKNNGNFTFGPGAGLGDVWMIGWLTDAKGSTLMAAIGHDSKCLMSSPILCISLT